MTADELLRAGDRCRCLCTRWGVNSHHYLTAYRLRELARERLVQGVLRRCRV